LDVVVTDYRSPSEIARLEAAIAWHVRLAGDAQLDDWRAFTAWLEADAENRAAFDCTDALAAEIDLHKGDLPANAAAIPASGILLAFRHHVQSGWTSSRAVATGLIAMAAIVLLAIFVQPHFYESSTVEAFATQIGERKNLQLADGSEIQLNTDSKISVTLERQRRTVRLEKGEALFDVASDPSRPFHVMIGDQHVQVVGTAFNIIRHDGDVAVTVVSGVVQVSRASAPAGDTQVRLTRGDQFVRHDGDREYRLTKVDPAVATAWREGRLVFEDTPLSEVVSNLNRYFPKIIHIEDKSIEHLRFTGILKMDDEGAVLRRLEAFLPVAVQEQGDDVLLTRRQKE
jgi:transmembrane sensor